MLAFSSESFIIYPFWLSLHLLKFEYCYVFTPFHVQTPDAIFPVFIVLPELILPYRRFNKLVFLSQKFIDKHLFSDSNLSDYDKKLNAWHVLFSFQQHALHCQVVSSMLLDFLPRNLVVFYHHWHLNVKRCYQLVYILFNRLPLQIYHFKDVYVFFLRVAQMGLIPYIFPALVQWRVNPAF